MYLPIYGPEAVAHAAAHNGCPYVDISAWQVVYNTDMGKDRPWLPWDVVRAYVLFEFGESPSIRNSDNTYRVLPGTGTLAEQLAALPLFSLETGWLLHNEIRILGPETVNTPPPPLAFKTPPPRPFWSCELQAWEIGADGFEVEETYIPRCDDCGVSFGKPALRLVKIDADGRHEVTVVEDRQ